MLGPNPLHQDFAWMVINIYIYIYIYTYIYIYVLGGGIHRIFHRSYQYIISTYNSKNVLSKRRISTEAPR